MCPVPQIWTNRLLKEFDGIESRLPKGVTLYSHTMQPEEGVCRAVFDALVEVPASGGRGQEHGEGDEGHGDGDGRWEGRLREGAIGVERELQGTGRGRGVQLCKRWRDDSLDTRVAHLVPDESFSAELMRLRGTSHVHDV